MPSKKKKKNALAFPLGLLTVILAVLGAVYAAGLIKNVVKSFGDDSAERAEYAEFLKPVVMFDPDAFDDISSADLSQLVNISAWSLIMNDDSAEKYSYSTGSEVGVLIPQDDISAEFSRLFGNEVNVSEKFSTLEMSEYDISYDPAQGGFIIPITSNEIAYVPNVTKLETRGDSVILTVELIGSKAWADISESGFEAPQADKTLTVTLRKNAGSFYVASLQRSGTVDVAAVTGTLPQVTDFVLPDVSETNTQTAGEGNEAQSEQTSQPETETTENG